MVTMAVTNRHDSSAPVGMGLHPFFPKRHDPVLRFAAGGVWDNGPDALPLRHMAVPAAWDHATQRPVASSRLDNCFTGWDGVAAFAAGPVRVRVEASAVFGNVQVFTPGWADFFCVEPVTHVPDAVNGVGLPAGQGMDELGPGAVLRGAVCISVAVG
jgi:aldose 1-epimerase